MYSYKALVLWSMIENRRLNNEKSMIDNNVFFHNLPKYFVAPLPHPEFGLKITDCESDGLVGFLAFPFSDFPFFLLTT